MEKVNNVTDSPAAPSEKQKKVWRAGTLTYTTGGLILLGLYLLGGDFPWALKDRAVMPSATVLIKDVIGVPEVIYGLIIVSFPNFTNLFLAPVVSYVSDRHRGRWGRRIPFLMFTTPFIVAGLFLLGLTPFLGGWLSEMIPSISKSAGMLIFFCIAWVLLDFGTTLSGSLFNALVNDVVPREMVGRFFGLFRMVSLGAGIFYNKWLFAKVETHTAAIFLGIGVLYGLGLLLLCLKVKEGEYPPPAELPPRADGQKEGVYFRVMRSVITYFRQSFSLPYYRWYMLAVAIAALSFTPINYFAIQYAGNLEIAKQQFGHYLVITYLFSLVLSYFLGAIADRFHPLRAGITALIGYLIVMICGWFFLNDSANFGFIFVTHGVVSGCYMTLTASLASRLVPRELYAQFGSAVGLINALLLMIIGPLFGGLLDLLNYNYRLLFIMAGIITFVAILLLFKVYRNFLANGGDAAYQAPMPK